MPHRPPNASLSVAEGTVYRNWTICKPFKNQYSTKSCPLVDRSCRIRLYRGDVLAGPWCAGHNEDGHNMTKKVIELFGERGAGRSMRVRNKAEASGRTTGGVLGQDPEEAGCTEDKAGALARMVLDHREGLGLSQREFAKESGISRTILSKVEQGELYPGGKVRRKLAAAMDLTPMDLWWIGPDAVHRHNNSRNGFSSPDRQTRHTQHREAS